MNQVLLELEAEEAVFVLAPRLQRLENVETALTVTRKHLERLALLRVEAREPDGWLLPGSRRRQLLHRLENYEPWVKQ